MPRSKSNNTTQISFKVPEEWLEDADTVAGKMSAGNAITVTRTEAIRIALGRGLKEMLRPRR